LITGHTGFKGAWLSLWLRRMGARVTGYALAPTSMPNLWDIVGGDTPWVLGDVRDAARFRGAVQDADPQIVVHMAAQALVRESYRDPLGTYATNVLGTGALLQACRELKALECVVIVTSDKVYENSGAGRPFEEDDRLGGHDPYSNSKACAELLTSSFRESFFKDGPPLATVRAGNVIGGGDWSQDRLIPDCVRGLETHTPVLLRYPDAVRPWQHVLEPLGGYLVLAERLWRGDAAAAAGWNFGPNDDDARPVGWIADRLAELWGDGAGWDRSRGEQPHEAASLRLDWSKARAELGWRPAWTLDRALQRTVAWRRALEAGGDARALTLEQIHEYGTPVHAAFREPWARHAVGETIAKEGLT
jgi:CDP-glucose 4,6-dehydratase